jgi:hypothetical protein
MIDPALTAFLTMLVAGQSGNGDNGKRISLVSDGPGNGESVHARHLDIEQQKIIFRGPGCEFIQSFLAIGTDMKGVYTQKIKGLPDQFLIHGVVFGNENVQTIVRGAID